MLNNIFVVFFQIIIWPGEGILKFLDKGLNFISFSRGGPNPYLEWFRGFLRSYIYFDSVLMNLIWLSHLKNILSVKKNLKWN